MFRGSRGDTTVSSQISMSSTERDIATLQRDEYEVLGTAEGKAFGRRVFILWFPVGEQMSTPELEANAAYDAVGKVKNCDEVLFPHTKNRRIVIPLLLVNVVIKKVKLRGRCVRMKHDGELGVAVEAEVVDTAPTIAPAAPTVAPAPVEPAPVAPQAPA